MSYSQGAEEQEILRAVGDKIGSFLDIGAYDPKVFSNTRALFERGWKGVMVEPSPYRMPSLIEEYGNDERITLIQAAVGDGSLLKMWMTPDALSTSNEESHKLWATAGGFKGIALVPTVTLAQIWNQFGGFDFVNIDAEGESASIFLEYLRSPARPRCFCVEHDGREVEIAEAAGKKGYKLVLRTGENVVFAL